MTRRLGAVVLVALACGGQERDPDAEGTIAEPAEPGAEMPAPSGEASAPVEAPLEACLGPPGAESIATCKTCLAGAVPRCLNEPLPKSKIEPAACAAPHCELSSNPVLPDIYFESLGECSDGKEFIAQLGRFRGVVIYSRDGVQVGTAEYSFIVTDCACSGEAFSGDVLCPSPTFVKTPPDGELKFPFADGHRTAPCMCAD